jgi:4-coumarate--CoA ligase
LIDPENPSNYYSYTTAKDLVKRLIAGLHNAGLQRGDTVCLSSFNSIAYPLVALAIIGAGGISVGTNPSYTKHELNHAVKLAKIKFVLAEPEIVANVQTALQENGVDVGSRLFILDTHAGQKVPSGLKSWKTLLSHGTREWIRFDDKQRCKEHVQLYFTSGTSGLPKCAMTSHRNLTAEHQLFFEAWPRSYPFRVVLCMPFFHVGVFPQVLVSALKEGREGYIMRRFDLKPYLRYHAKYQVTEIFSVPPMLVSIVMSGLADPKSKEFSEEFNLKSVRNGTVGAAPCSAELQKRFQDLLGDGATMGQVWGMTGKLHISSLNSPVPARMSPGFGTFLFMGCNIAARPLVSDADLFDD